MIAEQAFYMIGHGDRHEQHDYKKCCHGNSVVLQVDGVLSWQQCCSLGRCSVGNNVILQVDVVLSWLQCCSAGRWSVVMVTVLFCR